jgi:hypothetical protein
MLPKTEQNRRVGMFYRLVIKADNPSQARLWAQDELSVINAAYFSVGTPQFFGFNEYVLDVEVEDALSGLIVGELNKWFLKDHLCDPPFEVGSLLWWRSVRKTTHASEVA